MLIMISQPPCLGSFKMVLLSSPYPKTSDFLIPEMYYKIKWVPFCQPAKSVSSTYDYMWRCLTFNLLSICRVCVNFHGSVLIWQMSSRLYTYICVCVRYTDIYPIDRYISWPKSSCCRCKFPCSELETYNKVRPKVHLHLYPLLGSSW